MDLETMKNNELVEDIHKSSYDHLTTIRKVVVDIMEQHTLRNVNNYLNTNMYSYLETSGGQSSNLYLIAVHFFNTSVN
jgi:hypothetical protein